ncbi:MAG: preprotein translocase subunit SecA [Gemmatimonadetes bacterium]|nr:preprotein translocase subunit SecA [Gemmatimonadota bacterium]
MLKKLIGAVFGTRHEREQRRVQPIVDDINGHYARLRDLSDADLQGQTARFRATIEERTAVLRARIEELKAQKHAATEPSARDALDAELAGPDGQGGVEAEYRALVGEVLDELLPEAFATVREAARRLVGTPVSVIGREMTWDMVHYDVQLVGGIQLHLGKIAEMATGEGKTLVATLPLYLNALPGRGAHLVTVNNYLARRDSQWMGHLYRWLGLTVGCLDDTEPGTPERRAAYLCDITYGTNNEFGFDYLRDNMVVSLEQRVQRPHVFAIVDEVDSVLVDEARTPLIISGPVGNDGDVAYAEHNTNVARLVRKQTELVNDLVGKGERALEAGQTEEAGLAFYQARMGSPKNKRLLKVMQETGVKQLIQQKELQHLADRKLPAGKQEFREIEELLLFVLDEKGQSVHLTDRGVDFLSPDKHDQFVLPDIATEMGRIDRDHVMDPAAKLEARRTMEVEYAIKSEKLNIIHQLLRAHALFEKDVNYVVQEGQVLIVDEFTGRTMPGRRWSEGLHQAVEAKEGVVVRGETQTLATITIQNYFRLYEKLAGMTGTAETEETEFFQIYGLEVAVIPTNKPAIRDDRQDLVYKTRREKYNGILEETRRLHELGFPVLVGTTSVEASETLSRLFQRAGLPHNVLNAKYHQREAEIVALAGQHGAITIATNMAGRGTDIKLGEGVRTSKPSVVKDADGKDVSVSEIGGLHIIGSERHESRRIDRQLRGRAGRQGDPGSSQFYLSLEDDLMRLFGSDRIARLMDSMGAQEGEVLTHPLITRSIEQAQKRVELQNFQSRKRLLDYDDVMNQQREVIYSLRSFALEGGEELKGEAEKMVNAAIARRVETTLATAETPEDWDLGLLRQDLMMHYLVAVDAFDEARDRPASVLAAQSLATAAALEAYQRKFVTLGDFAPRLLSLVMLNVLDEKWKDHLYDLDQLRAAIGYRSWGQKDPLVEYKQDAYKMFEDLMTDIQHTFTERFLKVQLVFDEPRPAPPPPTSVLPPMQKRFNALGVAEDVAPTRAADSPPEPPRPEPKVVGAGRGVSNLAAGTANGNLDFTNVGRNDPCPCGSGKKFKKCHGA